MTNATDKVIEILKDITGAEEIELSESLSDDLKLDSLNRILLLVLLEEELDTEFDESHLNPYDLITVADVVRLAKLYIGEENGKIGTA